MRCPFLLAGLILLFLLSACNTGKNGGKGDSFHGDAAPAPRKVIPPKIPDRISEKEAYMEFLDTLSSPAGLSVIMTNPDDRSTFTFCNDTLVILQFSTAEWMLGTWKMHGDEISIHFFKAAGDRGIGDPVVSSASPSERPVYAEYVPYVYFADEDKMLPWQEMKAIMRTGGNSVYILADKKVSCDLNRFNLELPGKYPFISSRLIDESEVANITEEELSIMINEVYARYGLTFTDKKLREYFKKQSWYKARYTNVEKYLQGIEEKNLILLKKREQQIQQAKPKKKATSPAARKKKNTTRKTTK
ncbi:MAG: YARHG domain-containing protein [Bacteroidales bacterium]